MCLLLALASRVPFGITLCRLYQIVPAHAIIEVLDADFAGNISFDTVVMIEQSARHNTPEFADI